MNYRYEGWLHIWGEFRLLEVMKMKYLFFSFAYEIKVH